MLKAARVCDLHDHAEGTADPACFDTHSTDSVNGPYSHGCWSASVLFALLTSFQNQPDGPVRQTVAVLQVQMAPIRSVVLGQREQGKRIWLVCPARDGRERGRLVRDPVRRFF